MIGNSCALHSNGNASLYKPSNQGHTYIDQHIWIGLQLVMGTSRKPVELSVKLCQFVMRIVLAIHKQHHSSNAT